MSILIPFVGGLGMFIYGMQIMAKGLENAAGNKMKTLLEVLTKNKFYGVLLGALITAVIQSSSATTVMVVGFVNAGIMNLTQAMGVIMGANIGTTVTGWLVSSVEWAKALSPSTLAPIAIMIGVIIMLTGKRYATKEISNIIIGFGILFVGITTMSAAVEPLKDSEVFVDMFVTLGKNPVLGILAGAVVTAIIQSSSASVGILQSLAAAGLVPFSAAIYIIMGQNIGTCVTAMISGVGAKKNAKTAGLMHLLFNVIGTVIFSTIAITYLTVVNPIWAAGEITQTQISLVHTVFNIFTTVLLFPVSGLIIKLAKKIGGVKDEEEKAKTVQLDDRMLETPGIAIQSVNKELSRMADMVLETLKITGETIITPNKEKIEEIKKYEKKVDKMTDAITDYAMKLSTFVISQEEHKEVSHILQVVSDMERISDHCENIAEFAEQLHLKGFVFTGEAAEELKEMAELCYGAFEDGTKAYIDLDQQSIFKAVEKETKVDTLEISLRAKNVERMQQKVYGTRTGIIFQDTVLNLERISDHSRNIAEERRSAKSIVGNIKIAF